MNEQEKNKQIAYEKNIASGFKIKYLVPQKGTEEYNIDSIKKILVVVEDEKWGFDFLEIFFKRCYVSSNITLVSTKGSSTFRYTYAIEPGTHFDYVIFIYDRGKSSGKNASMLNDNNRRDVQKGVIKFKKFRPNTKVFVFSPICMEELLLSFEYLTSDFLAKYNIQSSWSTQLNNEYIELLNGNINMINYGNYVGTYKSYEKLVEAAIEDITKNTHYNITHHPSCISSCWWENCVACKKISNMCNKSCTSTYISYSAEKLEVLAAYSLLGGLTYIMDKIYGTHYRKRSVFWSCESPYKKKLIEEV